MKITSTTAGLGIIAVAALMLGTAVIADSRGEMGMGMQDHGMMGADMMGGPDFDFAALDVDKDGKVSKDEISAFRAARVTAADANADGKLSVDEIAAMHLLAMQKAAATMAERMVERLDSDGDKMLTAAEMMDRPMPAMLFDRLDTNEDGFIDQAEADAAKARMMERGQGRGHKTGPMDGSGKKNHDND